MVMHVSQWVITDAEGHLDLTVTWDERGQRFEIDASGYGGAIGGIRFPAEHLDDLVSVLNKFKQGMEQ